MGAAHNGERGEHPHDRRNEGARQLVNGWIVGEEHKQLLTEEDVGQHKDDGEDGGENPRPMYYLLTAAVFSCRNILADHRHCRVLDALGDLVDDIVNLHAYAEGGRCHHADVVDHRVDVEHRQIDAARLDGHRCAEAEDHPHVPTLGTETGKLEVKAEGFPVAVKIPQRKEEGNRLPDDGRPSGTHNSPAQKSGKDDVQYQIGHRGDADKEEGTLGIAHSAQDCCNHIVACGKNQTACTDHEIVDGHIVGLAGNVHHVHYRCLQSDDNHREDRSHRQNQGKERADDLIDLTALACAQGLGDQHLSCIGETEANHRCEIDDEAALRDGRQAGGSHVLAHDDHIYGTVEHLQGIGCHKGEHKPEQLSWDASAGKVFG